MNLFRERIKESAVDFVMKEIKQLLLARRLKPGDRFPGEMELVNSLHVSRGSIREAMKVLAGFGIVEIRHGNGTYVAQRAKEATFDPLLFNLILTEANAGEIIELRHLIETGVVRLIIQKSDEEEFSDLRKAFQELHDLIASGVSDPSVLAHSDINFHRAMGRATKNPLVEKVYSFVLEFFYPYIERVASKPNFGRNTLRNHSALLNGFIKRDVESVLRALDAHSLTWRERAWD